MSGGPAAAASAKRAAQRSPDQAASEGVDLQDERDGEERHEDDARRPIRRGRRRARGGTAAPGCARGTAVRRVAGRHSAARRRVACTLSSPRRRGCCEGRGRGPARGSVPSAGSGAHRPKRRCAWCRRGRRTGRSPPARRTVRPRRARAPPVGHARRRHGSAGRSARRRRGPRRRARRYPRGPFATSRKGNALASAGT